MTDMGTLAGAVRRVRLFVSSPGDVMPERDRVERVVARLNAGLVGAVAIETVRWEHQYYTADATFQAQIADVGACDLVVSIFWQRLGTPLPPDFERMPDGQPYPSGTVYEVMKALEANRKSSRGLPDVLVYRKMADATAPLDDRERYRLAHEQREAFLDFWDRWFFTDEGQFKAAYNTFQTTDEFEHKLEQHLRAWLQEQGLASREIVWPIAERGSPYRGLEAFDHDDEEIFFGREREIGRAIERLGRAAARGCAFLLLVGESGSGKSSLARAGIVPKLIRGAVPGIVQSWRYAEVRAGTSGDLAAACFAPSALPELMRGDFPSAGQLADLIAGSGKAAALPILRALDRVGMDLQRELAGEAPIETGLVLLLDQAEGLLVEPGAALENLARMLDELARSGRVLVLATLRSDAYGRFVKVPALQALKDAGETFDVAMPDPAGMADIVRRPAHVAGIGFGRDPATGASVDEAIVASATGRDALPLVEFAMSRLYQRMIERLGRARVPLAQAGPDDLVLAYEDYAALGGLEGAIAEAAEGAFAMVPAAAQDALPRLLRTLVRSGAEPEREQSPIFALAEVPHEAAACDPAAEELVAALAGARILVLGGMNGAPTVRIAHEAVLRSWPRAREIAAAHDKFFRVRADILAAEQRWRRHQALEAGGADGFLLAPGVPLAEAQDIRGAFAGELSPDLIAFIDRSSARARRRTRWLIAASAVFALTAAAAAVAAGAAWIARNEAAANAALARANADKALSNFHGAADQAEALIVTLGGKLRNTTGVSREALKTILDEGRQQIEALAARDPDDHYVAQIRAKAVASIADILIDLGELSAARTELASCVRDIRPIPPERWDWMDRHVVMLCFSAAARLAGEEGKVDQALSISEQALEMAAENAKTNSSIDARILTERLITVGDLLMRNGKLDLAEKRYAQALDLRRSLLKADDSAKARADLAEALDRMGTIADRRGQPDQALASYREVLAMTQRLSADDPGNTELLRNLSVAYAKIGVTLTRTGNWADAVDNYRQSADLRRQLVDRDPGNWQWRALLAEAIEGTGVALAHAGRLDEGKGLLTDAIARYREVAQHDPRNAIARRDLARALNQYAVAILSTDRAGALTAAHESLAIFRGLVQGDSPPASALVDVAITMLTVADAGEDTRKNYEGSLAILRALDQQGTLPPGMRASMKSIEAYLDKLPKP